MRANLNFSQASYFLFCLFPLLPTLQAQSALAMLFLLLQVIQAIRDRRSASKFGIWFPFLLSLPTLILSVTLLYSDDVQLGVKYLERSALLLLIPWLLFFNRSRINRQLQKSVLLFMAIVMSGFAWYIITSMLATGKFFEILPLPNSYYYIREFMASKSGMHPTYFSILLAIPFFSLQQSFKEGSLTISLRWFFGFFLLSLFLTLALAASKMILAAVVVGSALIWIQGWPWRKSLKWISIGSIVLLSIGLSVAPLRDRANDLLKALTEEGLDQDNPDSMRKAIYASSLQVIGEHPWFGVGVGDTQAALNAKYESNGFAYAFENGFNSHNNYLHIWIASGLGAFILFVLIQLVQIIIASACRNPVHLAIMVMFSMSMLSENILSRQVGVFSYAFFTAFLAYSSWSTAKGKIFINGRFLAQKLTGVQRYAQEVSSHLMKEHGDVWILRPSEKGASTNRHIFLAFGRGLQWEQIALPFYLKCIGSPPLLNLGNSAPIFYSNNYLTLHDVAFMHQPEWFSRNFVRWYRYMIPRVLKKAKQVFTVSEFSKTEIQRFFKVPAGKITVVYNGIPQLDSTETTAEPLVQGDYALVVGSLSPRKNQGFIIDCFQDLGDDFPLQLVLAGDIDDSIFGETQSQLEQIKQSSNIQWFRRPSDGDLTSLYKQAFCVIYMPLYEGFGLPVLEALSYGKPTIVSDIPVFKELFEDLVIFSRLENRQHLASLLREMIEDPNLKIPSKIALEDLGDRFSYKAAASKIFDRLPS